MSWTYDAPFLFQNLKILELYPGQLLPNSLERTMGVILEPKVGEEALYYHHGDAHKGITFYWKKRINQPFP